MERGVSFNKKNDFKLKDTTGNSEIKIKYFGNKIRKIRKKEVKSKQILISHINKLFKITHKLVRFSPYKKNLLIFLSYRTEIPKM